IDAKIPPWKALTVVDIKFDSPQLTTYTTYDIRTLKVIENKQLPRFLAGHNGILLRRDVEHQDLTAEEKSFCEQRLGEKMCAES
ncbi:MAG: metallophosphoesterase, partial [Rivularia sp. (in: cyanobacteria)]